MSDLYEDAFNYFHHRGDILSNDYIYIGGENHVSMLDEKLNSKLYTMDELVELYLEVTR